MAALSGAYMLNSVETGETVDTKYTARFAEETYPNSTADAAVESVMLTLMSNISKPLDVRFNSLLLQIIEVYRHQKDEINSLNNKLRSQVLDRQKASLQLRRLQEQWRVVIQNHKDEVKRLEVILANVSKRGVAEVTLARQSSKIRYSTPRTEDVKKTIVELIERTNRREGTTSIGRQHAIMKSRFDTTGFNESSLSRNSRGEGPVMSSHPEAVTSSEVVDSRTNETLKSRESTFHEAFPEFDIEEDDVRQSYPDREVTAVNSHGGERLVLERLANIIGRRRNLDMNKIMPRLLKLFDDPSQDTTSSNRNTPDIRRIGSPLSSTSPSRPAHTGASAKRNAVVAKASGFFHRLKPHGESETTRRVEFPSSTDSFRFVGLQGSSTFQLSKGRPHLPRRFSFDPGDDAAVIGAQPSSNPSPQGDHLRKSVSMSTLANSTRTMSITSHSRSSLSRNPAWSPSPSRIPAPMSSPGSLARPRSERDGSKASLVTVIEHAGEAGQENSWTTSSSESAPSPVHDASDTKSTVVNSRAGSPITSDGRLTGHTGPLHERNGSIIPAHDILEQTPMSGVSRNPYPQQDSDSVRDDENVSSASQNTRKAERDDGSKAA